MVLRLCDRFHCTPETALAMDAGVFRMLELERLALAPDEQMDLSMYE